MILQVTTAVDYFHWLQNYIDIETSCAKRCRPLCLFPVIPVMGELSLRYPYSGEKKKSAECVTEEPEARRQARMHGRPTRTAKPTAKPKYPRCRGHAVMKHGVLEFLWSWVRVAVALTSLLWGICGATSSNGRDGQCLLVLCRSACLGG